MIPDQSDELTGMSNGAFIRQRYNRSIYRALRTQVMGDRVQPRDRHPYEQFRHSIICRLYLLDDGVTLVIYILDCPSLYRSLSHLF